MSAARRSAAWRGAVQCSGVRFGNCVLYPKELPNTCKVCLPTAMFIHVHAFSYKFNLIMCESRVTIPCRDGEQVVIP